MSTIDDMFFTDNPYDLDVLDGWNTDEKVLHPYERDLSWISLSASSSCSSSTSSFPFLPEELRDVTLQRPLQALSSSVAMSFPDSFFVPEVDQRGLLSMDSTARHHDPSDTSSDVERGVTGSRGNESNGASILTKAGVILPQLNFRGMKMDSFAPKSFPFELPCFPIPATTASARSLELITNLSTLGAKVYTPDERMKCLSLDFFDRNSILPYSDAGKPARKRKKSQTTSKPSKARTTYRRYVERERQLLLETFRRIPHPSRSEKENLAKVLNRPYQSIDDWYCPISFFFFTLFLMNKR